MTYWRIDTIIQHRSFSRFWGSLQISNISGVYPFDKRKSREWLGLAINRRYP
jgi:hypothetical protein